MQASDVSAKRAALAASAAEAAIAAAASTATMTRGAGRASYVEASIAEGVVDPGALAIARMFAGIAVALEDRRAQAASEVTVTPSRNSAVTRND